MTRSEFRDFSPKDLSVLRRIACGEIITFEEFYGDYLSRRDEAAVPKEVLLKGYETDSGRRMYEVTLEINVGEVRRVLHHCTVSEHFVSLDPETASKTILERVRENTEAFFRELFPGETSK